MKKWGEEYQRSRLHGKVISYHQLCQLQITRNNFLNLRTHKTINKKIKNKERLEFMPNGVYEYTWPISNREEDKYQYAYKILVTGFLKDGQRANVVIDNIYPYFTIRLKSMKRKEIEAEKKKLIDIMEKGEVKVYDSEDLPDWKQSDREVKKISYLKAKPLMLYQEKDSYYLKVEFWKLKTRVKAIRAVRNAGYETAHDDPSCYYRVACRDVKTTFNAWTYISDYSVETTPRLKNRNDPNAEGRVFVVKMENYTPIDDAIIEADDDLKQDKTMTEGWDIETYSARGTGGVPEPRYKKDNMFMISCTFQWRYSNSATLKVCLIDKQSAGNENFLTVVCDNEENLIRALGVLHAKMQPELTFGFNDQEYDWPWVVERGYRYPGTLTYLAECFDCTVPWKEYTDKSVFEGNKWQHTGYVKELVKLEAGINVDGHSLWFPGSIPVDVRTIFRQLYPTAEKSSLNYFLKKCNLLGKKDMPYQTMFRIYFDAIAIWDTDGNEYLSKSEIKTLSQIESKKEFEAWLKRNPEHEILRTVLIPGDPKTCYKNPVGVFIPYEKKKELLREELMEVAEYCVIDSFKCHELLRKKGVLLDKREMGNLSFTSLYDAFYRANGMKVRNIVISRAQNERNMQVSNINHTDDEIEPGKYPGAHVIPPKNGLVRPKLSLDERPAKARIVEKINAESLDRTRKKGLPDSAAAKLKNEHLDWLDISDALIDRYKKIILKHGAIIAEDKIPDIEKEEGIEFPKCFKDFLVEKTGRPIGGLDFSSLYPSLMMTYNFSPEYAIIDKEYAKSLHERGVKINPVRFNYNGRKVKGWFVHHNNELKTAAFGLYPTILLELKQTRSAIRKPLKLLSPEDKERNKKIIESKEWSTLSWEKKKESVNWKKYGWEEKLEVMEKETELFKEAKFKEEYDIVNFYVGKLNSKQKALKVFMNTFYGETGNKRSPLFLLQIAGGITSSGQRNLKMAQGLAEGEDWGIQYGDSVTGDTPTLIRTRTKNEKGEESEVIEYREIQDVFDEITKLADPKHVLHDKKTQKFHTYIPLDDPMRWEVWSDKGWTPIKYVMKHKTKKRIFRILTPTGLVDVTEDHSLLRSDGQIIKPSEVKIGQPLLHTKLPNIPICDLPKSSVIDKQTNKVQAANLCLILEQFNTQFKLDIDHEGNHVIRPCKAKEQSYKHNNTQIKKIIDLGTTEQFVYDFETESHHFSAGIGQMVVHNTDSVYIYGPDKFFDEYDRSYYSGTMEKGDCKTVKEAYCVKLVERTFQEIKPLNERVNAAFIADNGTKFLKMAYEELLFLSLWNSKKKYGGYEHVSIANFSPKHLFIRGLDFTKRGASNLMKKIYEGLLWTCFSLDNLFTPMELVQIEIGKVYDTNWDFDDFISTNVYRVPEKGKPGNVKINTFVARMKEIGITQKPGDRFNFVMVKKYPYTYDARGRKRDISKGDQMEYADRAKELKMEIDLDYYMKGSIAGQLARLITYHEDFYVAPLDDDDKDEIKKADDKTHKKARKYVDELCKPYFTNYKSKGPIYQKIFRISRSHIKNTLTEAHGHTQIVDLLGASWDLKKTKADLLDKAKKAVAKEMKGINYGKNLFDSMIKAHMNKFVASAPTKPTIKQRNAERKKFVTGLCKTYLKGGIIRTRMEWYDERQNQMNKNIEENIAKLNEIYTIHESLISRVSDVIKKHIDIDNKFNEPHIDIVKYEDMDNSEKLDDEKIEEVATEEVNKICKDSRFLKLMDNLRRVYDNLVNNEMYKHCIESMKEYLIKKQSQKIRYAFIDTSCLLKRDDKLDVGDFDL